MIMFAIITTQAFSEASEACLGGREGPVDVNRSSTLFESASPGPILLRPEGIRSVLHLRQDLQEASPGQVLRQSMASWRLMLLLCDLRAVQTPETLFHIYLNLPQAADATTRKRHLLAQVNFFRAIRPGDPMPVWQSFDITQVVGTLLEHGMLETEATLTIVAARTFDPLSRPSVGRLAIVQQ